MPPSCYPLLLVINFSSISYSTHPLPFLMANSRIKRTSFTSLDMHFTFSYCFYASKRAASCCENPEVSLIRIKKKKKKALYGTEWDAIKDYNM